MPRHATATLLIAALAACGGTGCTKHEQQPSAGPSATAPHPAAHTTTAPAAGALPFGLTQAQAAEPLATVGDRTITVGDFAHYIAEQPPNIRPRFNNPQQRRELLEHLIQFELLALEAKRQGYMQSRAVVRGRQNALITALREHEIDEQIPLSSVTMKQVRAYYEAHPEEFNKPEQVRVSDVFTTDRKTAQKVLKQALADPSLAGFRQLAAKYNEDSATRLSLGDLRFFSLEPGEGEAESAPPEAVRKAAFSLQNQGDVYPTVIEAGGGYHVIKLTGRRAPMHRSFDQVERVLRNRLWRERRKAAMDALLDKLRHAADVEVDWKAVEAVTVNVDAGEPNSSAGGTSGGAQ
ncbi:MAG: peptidyl-prolyl cis-trans isomerase [Myxococcales bacterium]|nr:peptidyl-prolyl cis-trans isomerase [Myxococcales bacterium]